MSSLKDETNEYKDEIKIALNYIMIIKKILFKLNNLTISLILLM